MDQNQNNIPLVDCPIDYLIGDASGKLMNEYGRFPCKIQCGVFAIMVRGKATATLNINQYEFNTNEAIYIKPDTFLLIHEFSEDALVYYCVFSSSFVAKHTANQRMPASSLQLASPIVHLNEEQSSIFQEVALLLMKASNTMPPMLNSERMVHVFNMLLSSYQQHAMNSEDMRVRPLDRKTEIYQEYCNLVLKHYQEWHHVNQYADALSVTLPHLCSTIRQVSDRTASEIIDEAIMTDAKAQLKITNAQVKEIAFSLGFNNVAFFNRFFRAHAGVTPKAYRMEG